MHKRWRRLPGYLFFGGLFLLGTLLLILCSWYHRTYNVGFRELLYTLLGPLEGTGNSVIRLVVQSVVPPFIRTVCLGAAVGFLLSECQANRLLWARLVRRSFPGRVLQMLRRLASLGCTGIFIFSLWYMNNRFDVLGYLASTRQRTLIYEEHYVDPADVAITAPEKRRNLIHIYVESLETTYAALEDGGVQPVDLTPRLTALSRENVSFTGTDTPSGMRSMAGLNWTMASLLGHTAGIPFAFPVDGNAMDTQDVFAPKLTALGDILERSGYTQVFLCGSDASFAGRRKYFREHGSYQIYDLFTARSQGDIPENYFVWWGFEDTTLFDIARREALRLADGGQPFNLTILTVDLHHPGGYICSACGTEYGSTTADVVQCTDHLAADFVSWCREQPFFADTTIVITGDHPRMDTSLVEAADPAQRTLYNCIINAAVQPVNPDGRLFTAMDMFPTTLAALGYTIEGDRLGLGTNLFSAKLTLPERMGIDAMGAELGKTSEFYLEHFFYSN